eukprot:TRINITY_DN5435_c0_g1_i1.p1 TRINITY_DN5435_c0_g1~~TRINITY_DN5435_c0_g1_i1.p1  ORF type:complete len:373 (-),score=83.58 TRINITY_DN5435_c0_g1_i1:14-1132(-)
MIKKLGIALVMLSSDLAGGEGSSISVHMIPRSGNLNNLVSMSTSGDGNQGNLLNLFQNMLSGTSTGQAQNVTNENNSTTNESNTQDSTPPPTSQPNNPFARLNIGGANISNTSDIFRLVTNMFGGQNQNQNQNRTVNNTPERTEVTQDETGGDHFEQISSFLNLPGIADQSAYEFLSDMYEDNTIDIGSLSVFSVALEKIAVSDITKILSGDWNILEKVKPALYHKILQNTENGEQIDAFVDRLCASLVNMFSLEYLSEDLRTNFVNENSVETIFTSLKDQLKELLVLIMTPVMPTRSNLFPFSSKLQIQVIDLLVNLYGRITESHNGGTEQTSACLRQWIKRFFQPCGPIGETMTNIIVEGMEEEYNNSQE